MHEAEIISLARDFPRFHPQMGLGIGDDAAVLNASATSSLLWTTDLLIENVHFRSTYFSPADLAHKALAVNLSDIAAMAGRPLAFTLGLALPSSFDDSWIRAFFEGLRLAAERWQVDLIGGDTTRSESGLVIAISLLGETRLPRLQSSARAGDLILACGDFGAAAAGLFCLEQALPGFEILKQKQLRPEPLLEMALGLSCLVGSQRFALTDASDGLGRSLQLLCGKELGCELALEQVPVLPEVWELAKTKSQDPWAWIIHGGEDYALLASLAPEWAAQAEILGWRVIGQITQAPPLRLNRPGQRSLDLNQPAGFQHFGPAV
jgi:thiamine-monophosphate kinase